jgi:DNA-binding NtrC family response regulator
MLLAVGRLVSSPTRTSLQSLRALLVEDDPRVRSTLTRVLTRRGCEVIEADSVAAACSLLDGGRFDVVVTDLGLGDGSGTEVIARARHLDPTTPVVVLSGSIDDLEGEPDPRLWRLNKPASSADLIETVSVAGESRRRRRRTSVMRPRRVTAAPVADDDAAARTAAA